MKRRTYKESKSIAGRQLNLMALPGIVHVLIFNYLPMVGLILAFKKFNPNLGIFRSEWVGLANFRFFFMSKDFGMLMRNTLAYAFWFLLVDNFFAILLAVLFYYVRNQKALKYFQTTCFHVHGADFLYCLYFSESGKWSDDAAYHLFGREKD